MAYQRSVDKQPYKEKPYKPLGYEQTGIFRGTVEDDKDPLLLGRVRVRIPFIHGVPIDPKHPFDNVNQGKAIAAQDLPWCPVLQMGAAYQQGSFITPEVGSIVMVNFEANEQDSPVVLGTIYSASASNPKVLGNLNPQRDSLGAEDEEYFPNMEDSDPAFTKSSGQYFSHAFKKEIPKESQFSPKNKVIYKSPKGAIIYINETDGQEELTIRDRAGQMMRMRSPIKVEHNEYNNARYEDYLSATDTLDVLAEPATLELLNRRGDGILLQTDEKGVSQLFLNVDKITSSVPIEIFSDKSEGAEE